MRQITLDSKKEFPLLSEEKQNTYLYWLSAYHKSMYEAMGYKEAYKAVARYKVDTNLKPIERIKKIKEHVNEALAYDGYYMHMLEDEATYYNKLLDLCNEVRGGKIK